NTATPTAWASPHPNSPPSSTPPSPTLSVSLHLAEGHLMPENGNNETWFRYRDAMTARTKLIQKDSNLEALQRRDGAIAKRDIRWVLTLYHHALSRLAHVIKQQGEIELAKERAVRRHKAVLGDDFSKEARLELLLKQ